MSISKRGTVGCLVVLGLTLVGGTLFVLNRDRISAMLKARTEGAEALIFRLGEVMSISSALKSEYGLELEAGYITNTGSRILRITCTDCDLPGGGTAEAFARGIGMAAIGKTTKIDQIDTVEIVFRMTAVNGEDEGLETYSFTLEDLTRRPL